MEQEHAGVTKQTRRRKKRQADGGTKRSRTDFNNKFSGGVITFTTRSGEVVSFHAKKTRASGI